MNNVWVSIALRVPCRRTRAKPLLQLFSGYARSQAPQCESPRTPVAVRQWCHSAQRQVPHRSLSTSCVLAAKKKPSHPTRPSKSAPAKSPPPRPAPPPSPPKPAPLPSPPKPAPPTIPSKSIPSDTEPKEPELAAHAPEPEEPELSWRDYDPEAGMPLPPRNGKTGELSEQELKQVFGDEKLDKDTGNYILNVLHWRRMSGSLVDVGVAFPKKYGVSPGQAEKGLAYVRSLAPEFDERTAANTWIEEDIQQQEQSIRADQVKWRIYKEDPEVIAYNEEQERMEQEEESQQGTEHGRDKSKTSALQQVRQENEAKQEREKAEAEAKKAREEAAAVHSYRGPLELSGGTQPSAALVKAKVRQPLQLTAAERKFQREEKNQKFEEAAYTVKDEGPPSMSPLQRLGPSFIMVLAVLGGSYFLSEAYTPPPRSARTWPDTAPSVATMTTLVGVLTVAFVAFRHPRTWKFVNKYFTIVSAKPHAVSLLGAGLRHDALGHFTVNTLTLVIVGIAMHEEVGRGTFFAILLSTGACAGFTSLAYNVLKVRLSAWSYGLSGATLGLTGAYCALKPSAKVEILGFEIPYAVWIYMAYIGLTSVLGLTRGFMPDIDHAGHLAGMASGYAIGFWLKLKYRAQSSEGAKASREGAVEDATA